MANYLRDRLPVVLIATLLSSAVARVVNAADDDALVGNFFPYRAFQQLPATRIDVGGGALTVAFGPGELELSRDSILAWVTRCVRAVADYYGRLPDPNARLLIVPTDRAGVRGGTTYGYHGAASRILLGRDTTQKQLSDDWVLVHELVHQGFPSVSDERRRVSYGSRTYGEPPGKGCAVGSAAPAAESGAGG